MLNMRIPILMTTVVSIIGMAIDVSLGSLESDVSELLRRVKDIEDRGCFLKNYVRYNSEILHIEINAV